MADLFISRSFHCLWLPCPNLPSKPSARLRFSAPIPLPRRRSSFSFNHHTRMLVNSTSSSSSSVPEEEDEDEDFGLISSTQHSDGSFVFRFGNASEIRDKIGELEQQKLVLEGVEEGGVRALLSVEKLSSDEIESASSTVVVGVADQIPQLLVSEKESAVLDNDPETPVINDSQKNDRLLNLDSVEDSDDVAVELNVVPSVSKKDSRVDIGSVEVEEKEEVDKGHGLDRAANSLTGGVDADLGELVPVSTSLKSEHLVDTATNNLTGSVVADISVLVPVSTSLESEQVDYSATSSLQVGADADLSESVPVSSSLESEHSADGATNNLIGSADVDVSDLVPVSTSESEEVDNSATGDLTGNADADISELVSVSTCLESEHSADSATNNLTGCADVGIRELVPVSTSLASEEVNNSATVNLTVSADADISELVPGFTSLESEHSVDGATNNLTGSADVEISELMPVSTSLESEEVDNSATDALSASGEADISELVPVSTPLESEQSVNGATNHLTAGVDAELSELVPVSTSLESEQVDYSATDNLAGGVDADLTELTPVSTSFESELHADNDETTIHVVDDSVDASKMGKSAVLHALVPSSDLENKIDEGNTERSDYGNSSCITVPEIVSVEMAGHGEESSRTGLFLVSGAACLPHPSKALTGREDAYFISRQNWLAVADGVGQWSFEGSNTGLYIRELMEKCENIVSNCENISTIKPAEVLTRSVTETQTPGSSSVLVAYFDGQDLHAANVGHTGFIIIRDGSIFKKSNAMFHELGFPLHIVQGDDHSEIIEEYKIDLHDGDVIVFATNGLFDNLYEKEIASTVSKLLQASLRPQEIAELLGMRAQEVGKSTSTRSPFADAAQAVGYVGYTGGKLDDVTVIVSLVQSSN